MRQSGLVPANSVPAMLQDDDFDLLQAKVVAEVEIMTKASLWAVGQSARMGVPRLPAALMTIFHSNAHIHFSAFSTAPAALFTAI